MKDSLAQAIHEINKSAKMETNHVVRDRIYALKVAYLWSLWQSGDLVYLGSHFRFIPVNGSPSNRLQILHYYRSGSYSFHLTHLFPGMKVKLIGQFSRERKTDYRSKLA